MFLLKFRFTIHISYKLTNHISTFNTSFTHNKHDFPHLKSVSMYKQFDNFN